MKSLLLSLLAATLAHAAPITGKVVGIADGDTLTLLTPEKQQVKIRLEAIDAPEGGQEYGTQSKQALATLVFGKNVTVDSTGTDRYGRTLGWVHLGEIDVNRRIVANGWAWHFLAYNKYPGIASLQQQAQSTTLGLWAATNPPMPPWEYRALGRTPATPAPAPAYVSPAASVTTPSASGATYWITIPMASATMSAIAGMETPRPDTTRMPKKAAPAASAAVKRFTK